MSANRDASDAGGARPSELRDEPLDRSSGAAVDQAGPSPTLIPPDGEFEGQIAVVGETRIDGAVRGSLRGPGTLVLGPTARIEGAIECETLRSEGLIVGSVRVHTRARLSPGARFEGDLEAPVLEVDDAAVWNGVARVGPRPARQAEEPTASD